MNRPSLTRNPADRFLTATAGTLGLTLVTTDVHAIFKVARSPAFWEHSVVTALGILLEALILKILAVLVDILKKLPHDCGCRCLGPGGSLKTTVHFDRMWYRHRS
jgi:hypothetical protein